MHNATRMGEMKRQPTALLFDVDGTLIDTYRLYLESYRRALEPYLGYRPEVEEFARRRPSSERHFLAEWIGVDHAPDCRAEMLRHYEALHPTHCEGFYDGVPEMLHALRETGLPIGVVTGKGREAWDVTMRHLDLGDFDVVVTDDDVTEPKPHPAGLLSAAEALGLPPESFVYIGDSISDVEAGKMARMLTGAALWPKTDPEDRENFNSSMERWQPEWRFERPADVTRAFAPWC